LNPIAQNYLTRLAKVSIPLRRTRHPKFYRLSGFPGRPGLLLLVNSGIFFEFIPTEDSFNKNPKRLNLEEVELNKNYALISTATLVCGDTPSAIL
jgi:hypothetical protein